MIDCELCSGKLIRKSEGQFECEKCGMIYSIEHIKSKSSPKTEEPYSSHPVGMIRIAGVADADSLIKRGFLELEDGKWEKADKFFEEALNIDPENAEAYLGKLLAELKVKKQSDLADVGQRFDNNSNYKRIIRFGNEKLVSDINKYLEDIIKRNTEAEEQHAAVQKVRRKRLIIVLLIAAAAFFIVTKLVIPTAQYNIAVIKYGKELADTVKNASVGDTFTFGQYEQDNNASNGKEPIEWTILDKDGMSLLLISKQALDCRQYNSSHTGVTWENCSLRNWLNSTFLNDAFSKEEQALIQSANVTADKNPKYGTDSENATVDKVFLLSTAGAEKYFSSDEARKCVPTAYAKANGAYTSSCDIKEGAATCWWWLRSPGYHSNHAADVDTDGSVNYIGYNVDADNDCVRPALWISLDS